MKKGIRLPARTCTDFLYLSQDLGGLGLPSVADTAHVAKACQAFKFLSDMRDPIVRAIALDQLAAACAKRARSLDPRNVANLSSFLNTAPMLGEGERGDLRSIWSSVRSSLSFAGATISISANTALLNTESRTLGWENRKLASYHLNLHVANQCLLRLQNHVDQGRAFHSICQHPDSFSHSLASSSPSTSTALCTKRVLISSQCARYRPVVVDLSRPCSVGFAVVCLKPCPMCSIIASRRWT